MNGIELISKEREEQLNKHGYTIKRDVDLYSDEEQLQSLMIWLLMSDNDAEKLDLEDYIFTPLKGNEFSIELRDKLRLKTPLEKIIIVGALAAAEIDRQLYIANHGK